MTIKEKREALKKYCSERYCKDTCVLRIDDYWEHECIAGGLAFYTASDKEIEEAYEMIASLPDPAANSAPSVIKDSGERTAFESGAVRDMHEGKGRFDLLPMCVLLRLAKHFEAGCLKYGARNWEKGIPCHSFADSAFRHLVKYMDGYKEEDHLIAAVWNLCCLAWTEEKKPELMDIPARMEMTEHADN
jgi:hypothetical protein